ncbi:hypothetical protein BS47DRAFT_1389234 [Hydnum rufescens UP504]|uniref:Uncharacterized protein n=1 Tax=Hydnum rufescens UP504 TaxID=1448309 RepID=A0A9P6B7G2_9AGAM|nr:hypothetical protein BS47DRAFT_1389234 [Hydnum rufescens UP504]
MEDFEDMPTIQKAATDLGLTSPEGKIPGMEIKLMPHQLIGVDWMVAQENSRIKGGVLADDMGLGKTVQTIATMWKSEIETKTEDDLLRVHIHHGSHKLKTMKDVRKFDIVITTYTTLCGDFPKKKKKKNDDFLVGEDDEDDWDKPTGPLGRTAWHRVVLDEAQIIRNRNTRGSVCVALLDSETRWCLTGTPVTNVCLVVISRQLSLMALHVSQSLVDLYAFLRYLRYRPFNDWKEFNERIGRAQKREPELAGRRAQALLKKVLLRRTKNSVVEGKQILHLVDKDIEILQLDFSPAERKIYESIEARERIKVNKFIKAGTVMKNYAVILVMLLRLRQACNHPLLVAAGQGEEGDGVVEEDDEEANPREDPLAGNDPGTILKRATRDVGPKFVEDTCAKFRRIAFARLKAEADPEGSETADDEQEEDCPICFDGMRPSIKRMTKPLWGMPDLALSAVNPLSLLDKKHIYKASAFEPTSKELEEMQKSVRSRGLTSDSDDDDNILDIFTIKSKGKGKEKVKVEPEVPDPNKLDLDENWEPSTKMIRMVELIKQWNEEAPDDKIICYSQWTSMIDMVVELFDRYNIQTLRYDGKMSRTMRDETIKHFKKPRGPKILIISLKCGGVGLNLTEANRMICLDLAWNSATEMQAIDRCHRLGQMKPVHVKRLVVAGTVEQRILALQKAKQGLADAALGEGGVPKIPKRMHVNDIKMVNSRLFSA